jgi:hypothetical protein
LLLGGFGVLAKRALNGRGGDAVGFGDLPQAMSLATFAADRSVVKHQRVAADMAAFEAGAAHAGSDPLDDQVALQLRDGADDNDQGTAQRPSRVDLLAEADELDVEPAQLVENIEEVFH